jgi:hypothetical protein
VHWKPCHWWPSNENPLVRVRQREIVKACVSGSERERERVKWLRLSDGSEREGEG